jgi:hypothetical protein
MPYRSTDLQWGVLAMSWEVKKIEITMQFLLKINVKLESGFVWMKAHLRLGMQLNWADSGEAYDQVLDMYHLYLGMVAMRERLITQVLKKSASTIYHSFVELTEWYLFIGHRTLSEQVGEYAMGIPLARQPAVFLPGFSANAKAIDDDAKKRRDKSSFNEACW